MFVQITFERTTKEPTVYGYNISYLAEERFRDFMTKYLDDAMYANF